jgi:glutathione S-transferase
MPSESSKPRFRLYYWPIPFRGCFISYLFAWRDAQLEVVAGFEEIGALKNPPPADQLVPFVGPPVLVDLENDRSLSQMPAIVLYAARELDLAPADSFDLAMGMKVLMDCNDVLMEICRYNGTSMWTRDDWLEFRGARLPRWLAIFEESLQRGFVGRDEVTFADIGVFALFGNLVRCLPALEPNVHEHAPGIHALCARIGSKPSLAEYVAADAARYGDQYCGGQIEASIRDMLAQDAAA